MSSNQNLQFLQERLFSSQELRYLQSATLSTFLSFNQSGYSDSTSVVSAIGAFIACVTITLSVVTIYFSVKVYKYGEKQANIKQPQSQQQQQELATFSRLKTGDPEAQFVNQPVNFERDPTHHQKPHWEHSSAKLNMDGKNQSQKQNPANVKSIQRQDEEDNYLQISPQPIIDSVDKPAPLNNAIMGPSNAINRLINKKLKHGHDNQARDLDDIDIKIDKDLEVEEQKLQSKQDQIQKHQQPQQQQELIKQQQVIQRQQPVQSNNSSSQQFKKQAENSQQRLQQYKQVDLDSQHNESSEDRNSDSLLKGALQKQKADQQLIIQNKQQNIAKNSLNEIERESQNSKIKQNQSKISEYKSQDVSNDTLKRQKNIIKNDQKDKIGAAVKGQLQQENDVSQYSYFSEDDDADGIEVAENKKSSHNIKAGQKNKEINLDQSQASQNYGTESEGEQDQAVGGRRA